MPRLTLDAGIRDAAVQAGARTITGRAVSAESRSPQAPIPSWSNPIQHAEMVEFGNRAGCEAIPAGFVARKRRGISEKDVNPSPGQADRGGGPGRTCSYHQDIAAMVGCSHLHIVGQATERRHSAAPVIGTAPCGSGVVLRRPHGLSC